MGDAYVCLYVANRNKFQKKKKREWVKQEMSLSLFFSPVKRLKFSSQSIIFCWLFDTVPGFNVREIMNVCVVGCTLKLAY
ncbi:hypothetical protein VNO80_29037 [Phaseolus coccineus]|uniref:Uncharacterized protein n=1 Tax=Phaseolus coccineus TaxID=3886 RepID=A0AAN9LCU4_PHACN